MSDSSSGGGIGILGLLQVAFIVMKLGEIGAVAHWSWFWVLSPTIASVLIFLVILIVIFALESR